MKKNSLSGVCNNFILSIICLLFVLVSLIGCSATDTDDSQSATISPTGIQSKSPETTQDVTPDITPSELPTDEIAPTQEPVIEQSIEHMVTNYEELHKLATSETLADGEIIRIIEDFEISEPVRFTKTPTLYVEANIDCLYPIEIDSYDSIMCTINIKDGVDISGLNIRIDAPNCNVVWNGATPYDNEESIARVWNIKSYNGVNLQEKYKLGGSGTNKIVSVTMETKDNKGLPSQLVWSVDGNEAYLAFTYQMNHTFLENAVLRIEMSDGSVTNETVNLLEDNKYVAKDSTGGIREYNIETQLIEYNLPVVYIWIENGKEVWSKENYLPARISISTENAAYGDFPELEECDVRIKGRGHFTWQFKKKPYKIKFEKKTSILGMNASKDWVLLANYVDRSLIQNYVAMEMGKVLTNLPYHSNQYPVDVFVNGTYRGVYTLGEQLEVKKERINLEKDSKEADTDYLLEVGGVDDGQELGKDYFNTETLKFVAIKHPDTDKITDEQREYIINYMTETEEAVKNLTNYEDYIDVDSLVDWVIMHELTYNLDSCFRRSCYMIKEKGGKLKMGPLWDFDLAFGSYARYVKGDYATVGTEGGYVGITWMNYLMKDKAFMEKLTTRWNEIKRELWISAITSITDMSRLVKPSAEENFIVWKILGKQIPSQPYAHNEYDTYDKMILRLRGFLKERYIWFDKELNKSDNEEEQVNNNWRYIKNILYVLSQVHNMSESEEIQ